MSLSTFKSPISRKRGTLRKHRYLLWFKHIRASGSGVISTPKTLKNRPWNPYCHFGAPNPKESPKCLQGGPQEGPQIRRPLGRSSRTFQGEGLPSPLPPSLPLTARRTIVKKRLFYNDLGPKMLKTRTQRGVPFGCILNISAKVPYPSTTPGHMA